MEKIKTKIISAVTGLFLIGSTLTGAVATGFPEPFIKDGVFDGSVVVGENANAEDIIGSVDIMSSLQYHMAQPADVSDSSDVFVSDGYPIRKSGDDFNYGDTIAGVLQNASLSEDELPGVLTDDTYRDNEGETDNSVDYSQTLRFENDNAELLFTQDDDLAPEAGDYLVINDNEMLYTYSLEFDNAVEYDNEDSGTASEDFKTTTLNIQGNTYTVTDIKLDSDGGEIEEMSLISGDSVMWLTQSNTITKTIGGTTHNVEVIDVTESQDGCIIKVDGYETLVDVDSTETISGLQVGVIDAKNIHAQLQDVDTCRISLGSSELELIDGRDVEVDGHEIDGASVSFDQSPGELYSINIEYTPKDIDDDLYLSEGDEFIDPVFNSWKVLYGGIQADYDSYDFDVSGDEDGELTFTTIDNREISIPVYNHNGTVILGTSEDVEDRYYGDATYSEAPALDNVCIGLNDCEDMRILATPSNGELHVFEINEIDVDDNTIDVRDLTYGRSFSSLDYDENVSTQIDLGSFGNFNVLVDEANDRVTVTDTMKSIIELQNEETLEIDISSDVLFTLEEAGSNGNTLEIATSVNSDDEMEVDADWTNPSVPSIDLSENSDYSVMVSEIGTKVITDDDHTSVEIKSTDSNDDVYGNVFVTDITSNIVESVSGDTVTLEKLPTGSAKLDSEFGPDLDENLITVGGPCANRVTARVMGLTYPTCGVASQIQENTGMIKAYAQDNGHVALVVAGWEAENTRLASRVLADYDLHGLSELSAGESYIIEGTSLSNLNVIKSS